MIYKILHWFSIFIFTLGILSLAGAGIFLFLSVFDLIPFTVGDFFKLIVAGVCMMMTGIFCNGGNDLD